MRCVILAPRLTAADLPAMALEEEDFVICADGGYDAAVGLGIRPALVIGDFDSMPESHVRDVEVIRLPVHKEDTDTVVCLAEGRRRGYKRFVIAGGLGGRFGHTVANLQCLRDCAARGEEAWLIGEGNMATALMPGTHELHPPNNCYLSLLSLTPEVSGISLTGCEWELDGASLNDRYPLGVSNHPTADTVRLSFECGMLLLVYEKDNL